MIPLTAALAELRERAPRVCGDDPFLTELRGQGVLVLPAYAGMIPDQRPLFGHTGSAPRVCGDDPKTMSPGCRESACSPRMRG